MLNCYDSIDNQFICQLHKIKCAFADRVFGEYKQSRYGIKTCNTHYSTQLLGDLKELMEFIEGMDLSGFDANTYKNKIITEQSLKDKVSSNCIPLFMIETLNVCNISNLLEKINSL